MVGMALTDRVGVTVGLTERQARAIYGQGEEAVVFALLDLAKQLGESQGLAATNAPPPSTPSAMVPIPARRD